MKYFHVFMADRIYYVAAKTRDEASTKALTLYMTVHDELPGEIEVIDISLLVEAAVI